ncbi:MAG: metallophosphoesterase [Clostridia bacterium]|nr:metallophosphoesterase [Clostridia bacterium]
MNDFTFFQITDLHLFAAEQLGAHGKYYDLKAAMDQKCMKESVRIIEAAFDELVADKAVDTVIISGDVTFDGEKASHDLLLPLLQKMKDAGKRVYVMTATHDYAKIAQSYTEHGSFKVPSYTRDELETLYFDFGWNEAVSIHEPSHSYALKLAPGLRLLMLNDDGDGEAFCGYDADQLNWIKDQASEAKTDGARVIAVTHHPMLPPARIYPVFSHRDMLGGYETTAPFFADLGIEYIFTGHTHMQSIEYLDTDKGNRLYHVNTASITGYPAPYRKITVRDDGVDVQTKFLQDFDWDRGGLSVETYMKKHFTDMINDIFRSMEHDIEHFKLLARGFSMDAKTVDRLKPALKLLGKVINSLTFKGLGRILLVPGAVDPVVAGKKVKDFMLELILQMYSGVKVYTPDTPEYRAFMPMAQRVGKLLKLKDHAGNPVALEVLFQDLMFDTGAFDNTNAFLPYIQPK